MRRGENQATAAAAGERPIEQVQAAYIANQGQCLLRIAGPDPADLEDRLACSEHR